MSPYTYSANITIYNTNMHHRPCQCYLRSKLSLKSYNFCDKINPFLRLYSFLSITTGEASHSIGVENFRQEIMRVRSVFPDIAMTTIHLLADGDKVVEHFQVRGTHTGEFMGIAATGKKVEFSGITIVRIANGKLAERWNITDRYGLLQQLGAIPSR